MAPVLAAFLILSFGYAAVTPAWNNPDEPAHYNYVRHLVETGTLPELRPGDWDTARLEDLKSRQFPPGEPIADIRYESHQPPLYYLLAAPVLMASQPFGHQVEVLALRSFSIILGLLLVLVTYRLALEVMSGPHSAPLATRHSPLAIPLLAAGIAAFVPMYTAMSAAITNDSLANLLAGVLLLLLVRGMNVGFSDRLLLVAGVVIGALILTKVTTYGLIPIALVVIAFIGHSPLIARRSVQRAVRAVALVTAVAAALAAPWLLRQSVVYGWDDLLAFGRHDLVVVGQPRWIDLDLNPLIHFPTTLFQSFWAQFGWMGIPVDSRLYLVFALFTALALLGLALLLVPPSPRRPLALSPSRLYALLAAVCLVVLAQVVVYNLSFVQPQGRYLFPALSALAVLGAVGLQALVAWGRLSRVLLVAWLAVGTLETIALLSGASVPARLVYGAGIAVAVLGMLGVTDHRFGAWLRSAYGPATVAVLGLLNLAILARHVGPAFAG